MLGVKNFVKWLIDPFSGSDWGVVGEEGGLKKNVQRWEACWATCQLGKHYFYCVSVGQLSLCSQLPLLPLSIPPMLTPACSKQSLSQDREVWRVLTTTDVENVTHV